MNMKLTSNQGKVSLLKDQSMFKYLTKNMKNRIIKKTKLDSICYEFKILTKLIIIQNITCLVMDVMKTILLRKDVAPTHFIR